jgi:hypothetical protein
MKFRPMLEGLALAGFCLLVMFWIVQCGYLAVGFTREGFQGAWNWLVHITPRESIFADPPKHKVLLDELMILALTVMLGWASKRLWLPRSRSLRGGDR